MGKADSMDLRERLLAHGEAGQSCRAAARVFGVSASTAARLAAAQRVRGPAGARPSGCVAHRVRGPVAPKPQGRAPATAGKLAAPKAFLLEIVRAEPDITLKELAGALAEAHAVRVQLSSLHRALRRAGISYKKRTDRGGARQG